MNEESDRHAFRVTAVATDSDQSNRVDGRFIHVSGRETAIVGGSSRFALTAAFLFLLSAEMIYRSFI